MHAACEPCSSLSSHRILAAALSCGCESALCLAAVAISSVGRTQSLFTSPSQVNTGVNKHADEDGNIPHLAANKIFTYPPDEPPGILFAEATPAANSWFSANVSLAHQTAVRPVYYSPPAPGGQFSSRNWVFQVEKPPRSREIGRKV